MYIYIYISVYATDILEKINQVGKVSSDTYMVTLDVKSLHTNIDNNEGLGVVEEELEKKSNKEYFKLCCNSSHEIGPYTKQLRVQWC